MLVEKVASLPAINITKEESGLANFWQKFMTWFLQREQNQSLANAWRENLAAAPLHYFQLRPEIQLVPWLENLLIAGAETCEEIQTPDSFYQFALKLNPPYFGDSHFILKIIPSAKPQRTSLPAVYPDCKTSQPIDIEYLPTNETYSLRNSRILHRVTPIFLGPEDSSSPLTADTIIINRADLVILTSQLRPPSTLYHVVDLAFLLIRDFQLE